MKAAGIKFATRIFVSFSILSPIMTIKRLPTQDISRIIGSVSHTAAVLAIRVKSPS